MIYYIIYLQIGAIFLSYAMIKYKKKTRSMQGVGGGSSYEMKPLPPEPDLIPR